MNKAIKRAAVILGRQKRLADALGVTPPNVGQWIRGERLVPLDRCVQIQKLTAGEVTIDDMRPDQADLFAAIRAVRKR